MRTHINHFFDFMRVEKNYSTHTIRNYISDVETYIEYEAIESPEQITKYNIRSFLAKLTDGNLEASTRKRKLAAIRSFCKFLYEERHIANNPALEVSTPKIDEKLPSIMTFQQVSDVIESAKSVRNKALMELLYATGARIFEVANMKVCDVFDNGTIKLFGKNSKERIVPATRPTINLLKQIIESEKLSESDYIFHTPKNNSVPMTTRSLFNIVKSSAESVGVTTSPHKFRHSCATHLYSRGMGIRDIQLLLGHSNINTTTIYTKVDINDLTRNYHLAHPRG